MDILLQLQDSVRHFLNLGDILCNLKGGNHIVLIYYRNGGVYSGYLLAVFVDICLILVLDDGTVVKALEKRAVLDILENILLQAGFKPEDLDGSWKPYGPVGCERCAGTGYKGRVGIYEVMPISEEIQRIILADGSALEIAKQARKEGVRSLRESGLHKVQTGMTSLEEVLAVTNL